ncbi:MAG: DUF429 domain-containing protein [Acidimicrobiales bacterium]
MRTLGIDLAAQPRSTGACVVDWLAGRAEATIVDGILDDDRLVARADEADVVGIDVPLGWPDAFVAGLASHHAGRQWPSELADRLPLRYRRTDLVVAAVTGVRPLSVSSDLIAVCAFRGAVLQAGLAARWGEAPARDGSGRLVEVYPAGALRVWGLPARGYKGRRGAAVRSAIVDALVAACPWLAIAAEAVERCRRRDHDLDALVAALVTRAAAIGATARPDPAEAEAAVREGWIHLPTAGLGDLGNVGP